jgi:hypothetical protein
MGFIFSKHICNDRKELVRLKSTTAIVTGVYPIVSKSMEKNLNKYKANIGNFLNERSKELYDIAPFDRIYFGSEDLKNYYDAVGFKEEDIKQHINKTYYASMGSFNPRCAKDPLTIAMIMTIRYFYLKKMQKELELSCIYLSFSGSFYPSIHYGSFPKVQPSEYRHVMEYVVNNELSQKFDLKREGSVIGAIKSICMTWLDSYGDKLKSSDDEDIVYLLQQLHNRIKSFMKNIAELYYNAYENRDNYLSYDSDNYSQDNYHLADNDSFKGDRYINSAINYITTNGVNYKLCKMASDSLVRTDELKSIIESIQSDKDNIILLRELISITVMEYLKESPNKEITGIDFITDSIAAKPNTKNPNIIRQKEIIVGFLDENSPQYRKRKSRLATANSYQKSVLTYYVLIINLANK